MKIRIDRPARQVAETFRNLDSKATGHGQYDNFCVPGRIGRCIGGSAVAGVSRHRR